MFLMQGSLRFLQATWLLFLGSIVLMLFALLIRSINHILSISIFGEGEGEEKEKHYVMCFRERVQAPAATLLFSYAPTFANLKQLIEVNVNT